MLSRSLPVLAGLLILASLAPSQVDPTFVRDGDGWLKLESGIAFRVDPGTVTVRFAEPVDDVVSALRQLAAGDAGLSGLELVRSNRLGVHDLGLPPGADPLAVAAALRATGRFEFVEENAFGVYTVTPNDPDFGQQWNLDNTGQTGGTPDADVDAPEAWEIEDGDPSIVIAVVDSGTEWFHPDLASMIWSNDDESAGNGIDDDGNGFIDDIRGWNFDTGTNDPSGSFTHGTWVAGVVAAQGNNGIGISGLAGGAVDGQGCRVMPLNVGSFAPDPSVLDDAILYAADNGAHVITMSLTVPSSAAIDAALAVASQAGVFLDCSAGNFGGVTYPASNSLVMAVGGTNNSDNPGGFSSGPQVEVAAPGVNIYMTESGGGYGVASGTSFSSPHVAALAGLILSLKPELGAAQVRGIIRDTADDVFTAGFDNATGDGRVNAAAALEAAAVSEPAEINVYGVGLAGTGGQVPVISSTSVLPLVGATDVAILLSQAQPGASTWLVLGFAPDGVPFKGGTLLVQISASTLLVPLTTNASGRALLRFDIPDSPGLVGQAFYSQWIVVDAGGPAGFALTQGMEMVIGS
jgi:subtilisin family serine protease